MKYDEQSKKIIEFSKTFSSTLLYPPGHGVFMRIYFIFIITNMVYGVYYSKILEILIPGFDEMFYFLFFPIVLSYLAWNSIKDEHRQRLEYTKKMVRIPNYIAREAFLHKFINGKELEALRENILGELDIDNLVKNNSFDTKGDKNVPKSSL